MKAKRRDDLKGNCGVPAHEFELVSGGDAKRQAAVKLLFERFLHIRP
jgi:hypothetical protein